MLLPVLLEVNRSVPPHSSTIIVLFWILPAMTETSETMGQIDFSSFTWGCLALVLTAKKWTSTVPDFKMSMVHSPDIYGRYSCTFKLS